MTRPHHRRAFTLVELLVVIGILGVLTAMLLPSLRIAREIAQRASCASNLRQIGFAFEAYTADNHGWLPSWSGWHPTAFPQTSGGEISWCGKLAAEIPPDSPVYDCPSWPLQKVHNYFICAVWSAANGRHSMKLSDIRMGGRFVLSGDMTNAALYPPPFGTSPTTDDYDRDDARMPCLCFPGDGGFLMHRGGNNVLFDDLHVACYDHFNSYEITFHPTRMLSWEAVRQAGPDGPDGQNNGN